MAAGADLCAVGQPDAGGLVVVVEQDLLNGRSRPHLRPICLRRAGQAGRKLTQAAEGITAVHKPIGVPVEKQQSRARAARSKLMADQPINGQRPLEQVALKPFIQVIAQRQGQDAQEFHHLPVAQPLELPADFAPTGGVVQVQGHQVGRRLRHDLAPDGGEALHLPDERGVAFGVALAAGGRWTLALFSSRQRVRG
jgi:hypothetical protein